MIEALRTQPAGPRRVTADNLVAIASGKGGVGKTCLSISLAHALAQSGERILLFDGDFGLANVDVQLGLAPKFDLAGVLSGRHSLRDATLAYAEGGFDVIAGRSGSGSLAAIAPERLAQLCGQVVELAPSYDRVLLDLGAGVERTIRYLAARASVCLVITTGEPTALTDAYAFIKLSILQNPAADIRVVVNMAENRVDGERTYAILRRACENFLKVSPPLAGLIRRDTKVRDAIRAQEPLLLRRRRGKAGRDVEALAQKLQQWPQAAAG